MIERQAVRALILNPRDELLLMKIIEPKSGRTFWLTPGGGLDEGEAPAAGLKREVFEETGLVDFDIGPGVWHREVQFNWDGQPVRQYERYYLIRVEHLLPTNQHMPDDVEHDSFGGFRWWHGSDIQRSDELFAPRHLSRLLLALIREGPPSCPVILNE